jgi:SPP1 gp7 family putative phage head morphogenesis protein
MIENTIRAALVTVIKSNRQKMSRAQRQRGIKPQRWIYPYATEARYAALIRAWLRPMKDYVHKYLKENQEAVLRGDSTDFSAGSADSIPVSRLDAVPGKHFKTMIDSLNGWVGQYVSNDDEGKSGSPIYMGLGKIADGVFDFNEGQYEKGVKFVLGVEFPVGEDWWPFARDMWANKNYDLIKDTLMKPYISQVNDLTEKAVTAGWSVSQLTKQIQGLDDKITKSKANFIARDQIGKLNGEITQRRMESVGLTMYIWETSGDERVRPSHEMMGGGLCLWSDPSVYSQDGGKTWIPRPSGAVVLHPGMDYQCFPGSTKIDSFFDNERIYQRTYHGEMTTIITSKGKIGCTPNHPILTDKGWRPAKFINVGDRIVKVKRECVPADGANPQNSITTFDELFCFFSVFLDRKRIRLGDEDFHGDASVDQKVNVITTKSVLRNYIKADIDKAFFQKVFAEADAVTFGECDFLFGLFRDCFSSHCGMGFFGKAHSFLRSRTGHSGGHALGAIAWVQSILNKAMVDGSPSCAELFGKSLDTHAGLEQFAYFLIWELFSVMRRTLVMDRGISPSLHGNVEISMRDAFELGNFADIHSSGIELDTVVDKVIISGYEGHIYNLQNTNGWYMVSPEHYIVKNCRCTATSYWQELVGEADAMIAQYEELDDLSAQNIAAMPKAAPPEPQTASAPQPKRAKKASVSLNQKASEDYIKKVYPDETFITRSSKLQEGSKYAKGLIIPKNVKTAASRIPLNLQQREVLRKELHQAGILAILGNFVYLIPEHGPYGVRLKDAVVNGVLFEFRTITGNAKTLEWEFRDAKKKGKDVNVFLNIESDIPKNEVRRRIALVLERHPEYTGKITVSLRDGKIYFWDSDSFR